LEGGLDNFLQLPIVSPFNAALWPPGQQLLHFPPVLAVLKHVSTDSEIFFEVEILFIDARAQIVQISLSNLLGGEF
jgi:hypothetical protein